MKRGHLWVSILLLAMPVLPSSSSAAGNAPVEYTWTLAALGQGAWIGAPLYRDAPSGVGARSRSTTARSSPASSPRPGPSRRRRW